MNRAVDCATLDVAAPEVGAAGVLYGRDKSESAKANPLKAVNSRHFSIRERERKSDALAGIRILGGIDRRYARGGAAIEINMKMRKQTHFIQQTEGFFLVMEAHRQHSDRVQSDAIL